MNTQIPEIPVLGLEEKDTHTLSHLLPNPGLGHGKPVKHHQDMEQRHKGHDLALPPLLS